MKYLLTYKTFETHSFLKQHMKILLQKYQINLTEEAVIQLWNLPHRYYHTYENHLLPMLEWFSDPMLTPEEQDILQLTAIFHDIIYDPTRKDSEAQSVEYFKKVGSQVPERIYQQVIKIILTTLQDDISDSLVSRFLEADYQILQSFDFLKLLKYEKQIYQEFQHVSWPEYKKGRLEFLGNFLKQMKIHVVNPSKIFLLMEYVREYQPTVGVYCGSFNPLHLGHKNVLQKAQKIFDKVIVGKGINPSKNFDPLQFEKSFQELKKILPHTEVRSYSGFLSEFLTQLETEGQKVVLVRGLRNGYDLDAENKLMFFLKDLKPDLKVIYIPCDKELEYLNSTDIRGLMSVNPELTKKYLP